MSHTDEKAQKPGIGQLFAFSMSRVKEGGGLIGWLFALLMNRSGTRIGRFTLPSFGLWASVFVIVGWILPPPPHGDATTAFVFGLWFLGYLFLLFNRFDTSGPTREDFERAREKWLRSRPKIVLGKKNRNTESLVTRRSIELERLRAEKKKLEFQIDESIISLHPELARANQIVDRIQAIAESGGFGRPVLLSRVGASSTADALSALYLVTAETFKYASLNNTSQNQALLHEYLRAAGGTAMWIVTMFTIDGREFTGEIDESLRGGETVDSFVGFLRTIEPAADDYWKKVYARIGRKG